jgi:adhesin transport system membrane fusion protein
MKYPASLRRNSNGPALPDFPAVAVPASPKAKPPTAESRERAASTEHAPERGDGMFLASFALVAAAFAWAAAAELNITSSAPGDVVPLSYNQSVQHFEGGIVRDILVTEGESVRAGQPLVELDETRTRADLEELKLRLASLAADMARLEAEASGRDTIEFLAGFAHEHPDLAARTRDLFRARRDRLAADIEIQRQDIAQRDQEVALVRTRIAGAQTSLTLIREQLGISETLLKREITNRMKHIELLRDEATAANSIAEDRATLLRVGAALAESRGKLAWIDRKYEEETRSALDEARRNHSELSQRLNRFQDSLERSTLRAPMDGIVKTLAISTRGAVVKPGETVVELVPRDSDLVVDAHLPVQDIGYVRQGQEAVVTLAGSDGSRFGHIGGRVLTISPDTMLDTNKQPYYKVRVELSSRSFKYGDRVYEVYPGVHVVCSILTGKRTILDYVFAPILSGFQRTMQER